MAGLSGRKAKAKTRALFSSLQCRFIIHPPLLLIKIRKSYGETREGEK